VMISANCPSGAASGQPIWPERRFADSQTNPNCARPRRDCRGQSRSVGVDLTVSAALSLVRADPPVVSWAQRAVAQTTRLMRRTPDGFHRRASRLHVTNEIEARRVPRVIRHVQRLHQTAQQLARTVKELHRPRRQWVSRTCRRRTGATRCLTPFISRSAARTTSRRHPQPRPPARHFAASTAPPPVPR
jgi:hypothetical protein